DLDHFKRFNDEHGHVAGDRILSDAAEAWGSVLRRRDVLARWGGEEFVVLFPDTRTDEAEVVLRRMAEVTPAGLTFSAGLIAAAGKRTVDDALRAADEVLYRAKAQGRNRILCS
ncbi:MAG TPA: GGDEF domain-containing protein, partial [Acidimicrobiales bacterium]